MCEWKDIKIDRLIDGSKVTALIQWKGVIYNIPSFIYTFIQTYIYTIIHLFILSYMYSFIYAFIHSFIDSFMQTLHYILLSIQYVLIESDTDKRFHMQ